MPMIPGHGEGSGKRAAFLASIAAAAQTAFGVAVGLVIALSLAGTRAAIPPARFGWEQGLPFYVSRDGCFQQVLNYIR